MKIRIALILAAFAVLYFAFVPKNSSTSIQAISATRAIKSESPKALRDQAVPRSELEAGVANGAEPVPADCHFFWNEVAANSFADIRANLEQGLLKLPAECQKFEGEELKEITAKLYESCRFSTEKNALKDKEGCFSQFQAYRAFVSDRLSPDQKDFRGMSLTLLSHKIFVALQTLREHPDLRKTVIEMFDALIERKPDWRQARKAQVVAQALNLRTPDYSYEKVKDAVVQGLETLPEDNELQEFYLLNEKMGGHPESIEAYVAENPNSGIGYYFRASTHFDKNNKEAALADLEKAAELMPDKSRALATAALIKSGTKAMPFMTGVSLQFEDF